ncbi:MAG: transposase [Mycobacterium sp.]
MSERDLSELTFFHAEFVAPGCLEIGTLPWLLAKSTRSLFPPWLLRGWHGEKPGRGRRAWPAAVLMKLLVLRWSEEGMSRRASVRQAKNNVVWRAAMSLPIGGATPSEKTVRVFERFLRGRHPATGTPRYLLLHEHWVRLCLEDDAVAEQANWTMDSTPMWSYGAVLDTVRQLGDGLRMLARRWARATGTTMSALAREWNAQLLTAKSTKGAFAIDWSSAEAKAEVLDELARQVIRVVQLVRRGLQRVPSVNHKALLHHCRHLLRVVRDDLEVDEHGRLVIARRICRDRLISMTDPQARHGRKSKSKRFDGFKVHILGDLVSGVVASVAVTPGNKHDGAPAHRLIRRARDLHEQLERVLADTAYGGAELRHTVLHTTGVRLLAPPPPARVRKGRLGRCDIEIDFEANTATCANGVVTSNRTLSWSADHGVHITKLKWPVAKCVSCPLRDPCRGKQKGGHQVLLHPFERELRQARSDWEQPEIRAAYRTRSQCERLINQMTRHGARHARSWGLQAANLQAHLIAMRCNLAVLAKHAARGNATVEAA